MALIQSVVGIGPAVLEAKVLTENVENLIFEHLKKIQAEQTASRERDMEILARLNRIGDRRRARSDEGQNIAEIIEDRHAVDKLKARIERIERRLELTDTP